MPDDDTILQWLLLHKYVKYAFSDLQLDDTWLIDDISELSVEDHVGERELHNTQRAPSTVYRTYMKEILLFEVTISRKNPTIIINSSIKIATANVIQSTTNKKVPRRERQEALLSYIRNEKAHDSDDAISISQFSMEGTNSVPVDPLAPPAKFKKYSITADEVYMFFKK